MPEERRQPGPAVENRWWVDTGKSGERPRAPASGERPAVGSRFLDIGYEFDQARARTRLTDSNLKFLEEAGPGPDEWKMLCLVPNERVPPQELERMKRQIALPRGARGVIVDSGRSVRFIVTADPIGERILEFTLGEVSSFDCWIRGEWVREELFDDLDDALRKARPYLTHYLGSQREAW